MNFLYRTLKFHFVLLIGVFLFGCSDKSQLATKPSVTQTNEIKQSQASVNQLNKQKEAKPGAAVKLISPSIITINANEKTTTEISLEVKESSGELQIELSAPAELNLIDTRAQQTFSLISSNTIKIPVTLLATANGRYYLKIDARINNGDENSSRSLAVIIQVGPETEKAVQLKKSSGENVISLPAHETISTQ